MNRSNKKAKRIGIEEIEGMILKLDILMAKHREDRVRHNERQIELGEN